MLLTTKNSSFASNGTKVRRAKNRPCIPPPHPSQFFTLSFFTHPLSISLFPALTLFLQSSLSPSPFLTFIFHTLCSYPFRNHYFSPFPSFILFEFVSLCLSFCLSFSTRPFLLQLALPLSPFSLTHHSETVTLQISATQLGIRFAHFQRPSLVPGLGGLET